MNQPRFSAVLLAVLACQVSFAGDAGRCHFHGNKPASEATVIVCADQRKQALIAAGKLDKAWQGVAHEKVEAIDGQKGKEWKVSFRLPAASNPAKANLYLFFTLPGNFIAANHTGQ